MTAPLILLANDDGIDSPHLRALTEQMQESLGAQTIVVAPERQRSAMSHTITLHKPLRVTEVGPGRFAVSGSPVDCVYVGVLKLAPRRPDLVISGMNDGFNIGTDVFYSGTVGAAMEGGLRGIPSMAVSMQRGAQNVREATELATQVASFLLAEKNAAVLNLNVPGNITGPLTWASLGRRFYDDDVAERTDPRGGKYYWIGGGTTGMDAVGDSDCELISKGIPTVTPLALNRTCQVGLQAYSAKWSKQL